MADTKRKIREGYDQIAPQYLEWTTSKSSPRTEYVTRLLDHLPSDSTILELGCGAGLPVTKRLLEHVTPDSGRVVANDFSEQQIALARQNSPGAEYICDDMMQLEFKDGEFDAVVSFYAIFHLPQEEQPRMFKKMYDWLKPGGKFVGSLGTQDNAKIQGDFLGAEMHWSSLSVERYKEVLEEVGFVIDRAEVLGVNDKNDPDYGITFLWIDAHRPGGQGVTTEV